MQRSRISIWIQLALGVAVVPGLLAAVRNRADVVAGGALEDARTATVLHHWHFNNLPAGALGSVSSDFSLPGAGVITYPGTGAGYMDRVNEGTELGALEGVVAGNALRIRNPSDVRELRVELPSMGFEDLLLSYAAMRSSSGAQWHSLQMQAEVDGPWVVLLDSVVVTETFELIQLDLAAWPAVEDNDHLALRFVFGGSNASGASGNQRIDNLQLWGSAIAGVNLPPAVVSPLALQQGIENGSLVVELAGVFEDPENDTLVYSAQSLDEEFALAGVTGSQLTLSPLRRGDVSITVFADDGQNAPVPHTVRLLIHPGAAVAPFTFGSWDAGTAERIYPEHMLFLQSTLNDPGIGADLPDPYYIAHDDYHADDQALIGFPYGLTGRTRLNGLGEAGIAFINTGRGRDLGGALLALDTRNQEDVTLDWLGGTVIPNVRQYAIRLQYRTALDQPFQDLLVDGLPVEYLRNETAGHEQAFTSIPLPEAALDQPYVQVLWRYYWVSGTSGARDQLRLDNIAVHAASAPPAAPVLSISRLSNGRMDLSWPAVVDPGILEYEIQRGTGWPVVVWETVDTTDQTTWTDPGMPQPGSRVFYQVITHRLP